MMMRILLYDWHSQSQQDLFDALSKRNDVILFVFSKPWSSYDEDPVFEEALAAVLREKECQFCFSFNYFPLISKVCQREQVSYVSWIYDSPHTTLYSKTVFYDCNQIFTFDRAQQRELMDMGVRNVYHLPLAVNVERLDRLLGSNGNRRNRGQQSSDNDRWPYDQEVSFVGSVYENNFYEQIVYLPPKLKGYLEGICQAQRQTRGVDLLNELLDNERVDELKQFVKLNMDPSYCISYKTLFLENFLKKYISSQERKEALGCLSEFAEVSLFSGSDWKQEGIHLKGRVDYRMEMPLVFARSKLNLNLTIYSISSGIPLRALDIMGAGGALLSNVQPELEEYFKMDEEWIGFDSMEEMVDKAGFYLKEDALRESIARKGYQKVRDRFSYGSALEEMFRIIHLRV